VTAVSLDAPQAARRWWRTARRAAEQVGDPELSAFVLGQQAVMTLYGGDHEQRALELAAEAVGGGSGRELACAGTASATAAQAQALSSLGRDEEARQALVRLRLLLDQLPEPAIAPSAGWFGYPEYRVLHAESYVNTRLGRSREAARAQQVALAGYPDGNRRGRSQIRLHQAACMVRDGHVTEGLEHATRTLHSLPGGWRGDRLIGCVAEFALIAVPASARSVPAVADYRNLLAATPGNQVV
jgi:hypothetical protein